MTTDYEALVESILFALIAWALIFTAWKFTTIFLGR